MTLRLQTIIGSTFSNWTVLEDVTNESGITRWRVQCACGHIKIASATLIKNSRSKQCRFCRDKKFNSPRTHGEAGHLGTVTPEYKTWLGMRSRCRATSEKAHLYYNRGIKVCDSWNNNYENFLADMGRKPTEEHTLDRIDVNGDYCPENCRWATVKEQGNNRRTVTQLQIELDGVKQELEKYKERFGIL